MNSSAGIRSGPDASLDFIRDIKSLIASTVTGGYFSRFGMRVIWAEVLLADGIANKTLKFASQQLAEMWQRSSFEIMSQKNFTFFYLEVQLRHLMI